MTYAMNPAVPPPPPPMPGEEPARPIAHWTHTLALLLVLTATTIAGHSRVASGALMDSPKMPRYAQSILLEWLLLGAVIAGIYVRRKFFMKTLGQGLRGVWMTLGYGLMVYVGSAVAVGIVRGLLWLTPLPHTVDLQVVLAMAPHTVGEFVVWFFVSVTAGVCEELIFRGYLLQQLTGWTSRPVLAIVISGVLFGSVHLYEGLGAIVPLAVLGIVYGFVVRHFKGDLRAVMVAHFVQDFVVAFMALAIKHLPAGTKI